MSSSPHPVPYVPPSGDVFFPLASNAHALITGSPIGSVRARMKIASLLYNRVLLEAGQMSIQAGPDGAQAWRDASRRDSPARWQSPKERNRRQAAPFSSSIARETTPGVPAPGPFHQLLHSDTSICWLPTLEPFQQELPSKCDWILLRYPSKLAPEFEKLADRWKRSDGRNVALTHLVPENFVRSRLVEHISKDLALGASGGCDVSVDRYHGSVISARFAGDATVKTHGFALPILLPNVGQLTWDAVMQIRRTKEITRFRHVLQEVEAEAFEVARTGRDLEAAVRNAYETKMRAALQQIEGLGSVVTNGLAHILVGSTAGYLTIGLPALLSPPAGAAIGAGAMATWHVTKIIRAHRQFAWLGVKDAIAIAIAMQQEGINP